MPPVVVEVITTEPPPELEPPKKPPKKPPPKPKPPDPPITTVRSEPPLGIGGRGGIIGAGIGTIAICGPCSQHIVRFTIRRTRLMRRGSVCMTRRVA